LWLVNVAIIPFAVMQPIAEQRRRGWAEALAAAPVVMSHWLIAKVLASSLLFCLASFVFLAQLLVLLPHILPHFAWGLPRLFLGVFALQSIAGITSVFRGHEVMTDHVATAMLFALMAMVMAGTLDNTPGWFPVAGLAKTIGFQSAASVFTTVAMTTLLWVFLHLRLVRRTLSMFGASS